MSVFDFIKRKPTVSKYQAILQDGSRPLEERNAAYLKIRDEEEIRLNRLYDFNSVDGIRSIPVPCKEVNGDSPTGRVEYYLRGRCFAKHRDAGEIELATECIKKAHDLMFVSDMIWKYDAFISSISWLHSVGKHNEAWQEEERVDRHFQIVGFYPKLTRKDFSDNAGYIAWKKTIEDLEIDRLRKRNLRHEYYWIQENLQNLCPKSLSGYSRMKNVNSEKYQKIVKEAAKMGKKI